MKTNIQPYIDLVYPWVTLAALALVAYYLLLEDAVKPLVKRLFNKLKKSICKHT